MLAHEVGHHLLPGQEHADSGIMQADIGGAFVAAWFTEPQIRWIRALQAGAPGQRAPADFPPYVAAPVARAATLHGEPGLARAAARLAGRITDADMRALNAAVDVAKRPVADVVRQFLRRIT